MGDKIDLDACGCAPSPGVHIREVVELLGLDEAAIEARYGVELDEAEAGE